MKRGLTYFALLVALTSFGFLLVTAHADEKYHWMFSNPDSAETRTRTVTLNIEPDSKDKNTLQIDIAGVLYKTGSGSFALKKEASRDVWSVDVKLGGNEYYHESNLLQKITYEKNSSGLGTLTLSYREETNSDVGTTGVAKWIGHHLFTPFSSTKKTQHYQIEQYRTDGVSSQWAVTAEATTTKKVKTITKKSSQPVTQLAEESSKVSKTPEFSELDEGSLNTYLPVL